MILPRRLRRAAAPVSSDERALMLIAAAEETERLTTERDTARTQLVEQFQLNQDVAMKGWEYRSERDAAIVALWNLKRKRVDEDLAIDAVAELTGIDAQTVRSVVRYIAMPYTAEYLDTTYSPETPDA